MEVINKYGYDILNSNNMELNKTFIQHGNTSVYDHCINVTTMCLKIVNKFNIKVDTKSLVRGALLHDYFLYDWHDKDKSHRLHGFRHARFAYLNASKEFDLNKKEQNMILTHMFPLNLLCVADKICALSETIEIIKEKIKLYILKIG